MRPLLPRAVIQDRLLAVFPRQAFDPVCSNMLAASALAAMLYVDAVVPDDGSVPFGSTWARPSTCLWMNDHAYAHDATAERLHWRYAALGPNARRAVATLQASWGAPNAQPWYADNTRETLRDETFPHWLEHGAMRDRPGLATTSSHPRWAITAGFADLFDPSLTGSALDAAIETWRSTRMNPGDRFRIATLRDRERQQHATAVTLPNGVIRFLEPGEASIILRGVIESWAPARLGDPEVLTISEPGDKVYLADASRLAMLGITIDRSNLLPDAVIVDISTAPPTFWIIEAVASDGPVTDDRRRHLLRWAADQRLPPDSCQFLSAFLDRNHPIAKRRLKDLAADTYAWYASEPTMELSWHEVQSSS